MFCGTCGHPEVEAQRYCTGCGVASIVIVVEELSKPTTTTLAQPLEVIAVHSHRSHLQRPVPIETSRHPNIAHHPPFALFLLRTHLGLYVLLIAACCILATLSVFLSAGQLVANGMSATASTIADRQSSFLGNFGVGVLKAILSYILQFIAVPFFVVSLYLKSSDTESSRAYASRFMKHQLLIMGVWALWIGSLIRDEWAGYVTALRTITK